MKKRITVIGLFLLLYLVATASVTKTEAGVIKDEALGGMSKILDDYYTNKPKDEVDDIVIFLLELQESKRQLDILYRIVEAEATGGTIEQKMNVASCVLARVASKEFPNTIEEVVFQKKQFSPISDGRYYSVEITESTKEAVNLVRRQGWTHDCVWFCTNTCKSAISGFHSTLDFQFFDGMHNYYY